MDLMIASEFKDYVVKVLKRTDKDTDIYDATTDTVIDMRSRYPFDQFKQEAYSSTLTTLGDYKLDIPTELGHFIGQVRIINGDTEYQPLTKITKEQYDRLYPNQNTTTSRGIPRYFCFYGSQIHLAPVPDSLDYQYEVNYGEELFFEFTGTDVTNYVPFTDNFREVLRFGVLMRVYANLDNDQETIRWKALYEEGIDRMIKRDFKNTYASGFVAFNDL